jgi:hypothetical protein
MVKRKITTYDLGESAEAQIFAKNIEGSGSKGGAV